MTAQNQDKSDAQADAKTGGVTGAAMGAAAGGPVGAVAGAGLGAVTGAVVGALSGTGDACETAAGTRVEGTVTRTVASSQVGAAGGAQGDEVVMPVVEEELAVGKRTVATGGVRVAPVVTETPVEERVHLHEEKVKVERRPADRPATAADVSLQEKTLEVPETVEQAVIAKRARVVEEVVISKEAFDRVETVRDTVRRIDVDVQGMAGQGQVAGTRAVVSDADFQAHQAQFGNQDYTYEQSGPAYRFGTNLANYYRGPWATVEPEARRMWEGANPGTWADFQDAVRFAWEKATGQR